MQKAKATVDSAKIEMLGDSRHAATGNTSGAVAPLAGTTTIMVGATGGMAAGHASGGAAVDPEAGLGGNGSLEAAVPAPEGVGRYTSSVVGGSASSRAGTSGGASSGMTDVAVDGDEGIPHHRRHSPYQPQQQTPPI